ncbi:hypothetical protein MUK42_13498 [Musa troglodytarum]|uniref:Uncharacterized protein n=1 Tax=Musa troglodytarum TaxID=320322 RepID=A0A9E7GYM7_9LILI|nr:hypothetical protein MUK42_13498 [Musa troglodytarum]
MVSGFRRSLSLQGSSGSPARRRCDKPQHLRSISLPCRCHPTLSHHLDQIRSCPESGPRSPTSGLDRIDRLLSALDDLLRLPQTQDALRRRPAWADRVLDGFLRLADAHGSFRSAVVAVEQHHAESRAAIRRRDPVRLDYAARSHRRAEKELIRLATAIKDLARSPLICSDAGEAEVAGIVADVMAAAAATSTAVFLGIAAASSSVAGSSSKSSWTAWPSRRPSTKGREEAEMAAMEALEERMEGLEEGSGRVFRSLVNIRVSLLNILTPSL